ncbi:MAG: hypothetical protein Q4C47_04235, partial [Planctomycetia bacterium]|nr:hypothetical protein [Planctomycetia bacterium]
MRTDMTARRWFQWWIAGVILSGSPGVTDAQDPSPPADPPRQVDQEEAAGSTSSPISSVDPMSELPDDVLRMLESQDGLAAGGGM